MGVAGVRVRRLCRGLLAISVMSTGLFLGTLPVVGQDAGSGGALMAWGGNANGQVGDGTNQNRPRPTTPTGLQSAVAVAVGSNHTLAVDSEARVWAWGANGSGQLGIGDTAGRPTPTLVPGIDNVQLVSAGTSHSVAVKKDGTVWAWGENKDGQLGNGIGPASSVPVRVRDGKDRTQQLSDTVAVDAGDDHNLALKSDGTVWSWGGNSSGQLGNGSGSLLGSLVPATASSPEPTQVVDLPQAVAVTAGSQFSLALLSDGTLRGWGLNNIGQLGQGRTTGGPVVRPEPAGAGMQGIRAVSAGGGHALALTSDGKVWSWGNNAWGQLGTGSYERNVYGPGRVMGISEIIGLSAGGSHSIAQATNGTLWAWGHNGSGQLSADTQICRPEISNTSCSATPLQALGLPGDAILGVAGGSHTVALVAPDGAAGRQISITPSRLDFGIERANATGAPRTVTVGSSGSSPVTIRNASLGGAEPEDFVISSDSCSGASLPSGASCRIGVNFAPKGSGPRNAILELFSDAEGSPHTVALTGTGSGGGLWEDLRPMLTPRGGLAAVTGPDGRVYAIGGYRWACTGSSCVRQPVSAVEAYNPKNNQWEAVRSLPKARSFLAAATGSDGLIYAIGGSTSEGTVGTVEAYDWKKDKWTEVKAMPTPRWFLGASLGRDGQIYAVGGRDNAGASLRTVEVYDPAWNTWSSKAAVPTPRWNVSTTAGANGKIYAVGLRRNEGSQPPGCLTPLCLDYTVSQRVDSAVNPAQPPQDNRIVEAYAPETDKWERVASMKVGHNTPVAATGADNRVYAIGGGAPNIPGDNAEAYDITVDEWQVVAPMSGSFSNLATTADFDGRIYALGGEGFSSPPSVRNGVERYTPPAPNPESLPTCSRANTAPPPAGESNRWVEKPPMPTPRSNFAAAASPNGCIYVMGGVNQRGGDDRKGHLSTVEAYDPRTNRWQQVASMRTPRQMLTAATGKDGLIYVFGGRNAANTNGLSVVEAYDPATNRWKTVAPLPPGTNAMQAAATGKDGRIYVTGGGGNAAPILAVYEPSSNSWQERAPMPYKRYLHAATTGPEGFIYAIGGNINAGYTPSPPDNEILEQAYDPSQDKWDDIPVMPTHPRAILGAATGMDSRIYAVGGGHHSHTNNTAVEAYDPCKRIWEKAPSLRGPAEEAATTPNGDIYAVGANNFQLFRPPDSLIRTVSIEDTNVIEPKAGSVQAGFKVKLAGPPACYPVSLNFSTSDDTAKAESDYRAKSGVLEFKGNKLAPKINVVLEPGETEKTIEVEVRSDDIPEEAERFFVRLSDAKNAMIADGEGVGTILDDRLPEMPEASVGDVAVPEPFTGQVPAVFTVTLSGRAPEEVKMDYATEDGTAKANADYVPVSGTLTIPKGSASGKVTVQVLGDTLKEPTEDFRFNLSKPENAQLAKVTGTGRIIDAVPGLSIGDTSVVEGNADTTPAVFTVTNNAPPGQRVSVDYAAEPAAALAQEDFLPTGGSLAFAPEQNFNLVTVDVAADTKDESDEDFLVRLANASGGAIAREEGHGMIKDDDEPGTEAAPAPRLGPRAAAGFAPGSLPPSATVNAGQVQAQTNAQAQSQFNAQSQAQAQLTAQLSHSPATAAQTQSQGALAAERERQKEFQVEVESGEQTSSAKAMGHLAASRQQTVPMGATAVAWAGSIYALAAGLFYKNRTQSKDKRRQFAYVEERPGEPGPQTPNGVIRPRRK